MPKSKGTKVEQEDFDTIKTLISAGVSHRQIAEIVKRAQSTVSLISKSKDIEEYKSLTRRDEPKLKTIKPAPKVITNDNQLERIAIALERLADAWEAQPRKLFGKIK